MVTLALVLGSYVMLVGALLATASGKQPLFSGSGQPDECSPEHTHNINYCDPHLNGDCDLNLPLERDLEDNSEGNKTICININVAQLQLKTNATFFGLQALIISGNPDLNTTINCQTGNNVGIVFSNITRLVLRELTVINCGKLHGLGKHSMYSSAITILHCKDITLKRLTVPKSIGIGLMILDHQGGLVQVESSKFLENKLSESDSNIRGGGGVYVGGFINIPSEPITFKFENCSFKQNVAHTRYYDYLYTDDLGQPVSGYGIGGGAAILLEKGLTDIHVTFSGCTFTKNEAFQGAGVLAQIEGKRDSVTRNMSVRVEHSLFEENGCSSSNPTASGGGILINFDSHNKTNFHSNQFIIHNVTFIKNCAQFGGGLYFYSDHERNTKESNAFIVEECRFEGNSAHTGSAIDITPSVFERLMRGILTTPVFRDCMFTNNTVIVNFETNRTQTTYGIGTIYVSLYNVRFEGFNRFENNLGTAIHIVNGNIDASNSSVDFIENRGIQGGAIALIGESSIIFGKDRNYTFENNFALDKGGAIYVQVVDNHDITASKTCFFQYYDGYRYLPHRNWNSTITFTRNRASAGTGHTVFATSLYPCQIINFGDERNLLLQSVNTSEVFSLRGISIQEDTSLEGCQVATEGAILQYDQARPLEVIPGEQFYHGVTIKDDLDNQATVVLIVSIQNNSNVKLDTAFSSCVGEKLVLKGRPGAYADLYLHTTSSRLSYIRLWVKLIDCPPGFIYSKTSAECACNFHQYVGILGCNTTRFYTYLTPGFWVGMLNDTENSSNIEIVTSYCPLDFCNYNDSLSSNTLAVKLPQKHSLLNEAMCGKFRTGVACGSCALGYTTYFHSPKYQCKLADLTLCKVGWLFYILSELVPVTVVFITVLVLNISFTSGAVNGFILFSQLLNSLHIDASGIIVFPSAIANLMEGYKLIYGFFNLDFFQIESISFCLWPDASALDMLAFKYVTIVYALFLVLLVIWFMNKCAGKYLGKWFRITTIKSSVIHGISAFLILCYSQCVSISLNLLNTYPLFVRENSNFTAQKSVWLNGNIRYFSRSHLPYAIPAILCLLFVGTIPPLLLIAYPLSNKVMAFFGIEESKVATFIARKLRISNLKPLLDSFQGAFKDNLRFFAGLYFLYRWITLILTITLSDFNLVYTAVEVFIVVILILHALCQPYASKVHNMIDTLLFGNLAVINAFTFAHYYAFRTKSGRQVAIEYIKASAAIQLVLIYLPLLIMGVYTVVLICRIVYRKSDQKNAEWTTSIPLQKLRNSFSKEDSCDEEELPHRLIAGAADYECFEDTDRISYATKEESNSNDISY